MYPAVCSPGVPRCFSGVPWCSLSFPGVHADQVSPLSLSQYITECWPAALLIGRMNCSNLVIGAFHTNVSPDKLLIHCLQTLFWPKALLHWSVAFYKGYILTWIARSWTLSLSPLKPLSLPDKPFKIHFIWRFNCHSRQYDLSKMYRNRVSCCYYYIGTFIEYNVYYTYKHMQSPTWLSSLYWSELALLENSNWYVWHMNGNIHLI